MTNYINLFPAGLILQGTALASTQTPAQSESTRMSSVCERILLDHVRQPDSRFHHMSDLEAMLGQRVDARVLFKIDLGSLPDNASEIFDFEKRIPGIEVDPHLKAASGSSFYFTVKGDHEGLLTLVDELEEKLDASGASEPLAFQILDSNVRPSETFTLTFKPPMVTIADNGLEDSGELREALLDMHDDPDRGIMIHDKNLRSFLLLYSSVKIQPLISSSLVTDNSELHLIEADRQLTLSKNLDLHEAEIKSQQAVLVHYKGIYVLNSSALELLSAIASSVSDFTPARRSVPVEQRLKDVLDGILPPLPPPAPPKLTLVESVAPPTEAAPAPRSVITISRQVVPPTPTGLKTSSVPVMAPKKSPVVPATVVAKNNTSAKPTAAFALARQTLFTQDVRRWLATILSRVESYEQNPSELQRNRTDSRRRIEIQIARQYRSDILPSLGLVC
jgi:hypothetical protein